MDPPAKKRTSRSSYDSYGSYGSSRRRSSASTKTWYQAQKAIIQGHFGIDDEHDDDETVANSESTKSKRKPSTTQSKNDIENIINKVMEQPRFFKEGSVMNNLIESGIEVVWFSDLTQNDVVYGICCNRRLNRVTVVFRGTVNSHNWMINMKFNMSEHLNPIKEDYPGRENLLGLHTGFSLYMMRRRKDTGVNKIEEIFEKVDAIGREMAPNGDYDLSITGHSLGGALATILGFYVASSGKFVNVKTVKVFTFAAPRVGCQRFLHAYQHLERIGKLRHARFSNTNDFVPLVPFCHFDGWRPGKFYKHVGMQVHLHGVCNSARCRLRRALDVTYPLYHDWFSQLKRGLKNNIITNLNTLAGFKRNHSLTEHQCRIHFAATYRSALSKTVFFTDKKRRCLKTLDEYYSIRATPSTEYSANSPTKIRNLFKISVGARQFAYIVIFGIIAIMGTFLLTFYSISPLKSVVFNSLAVSGNKSNHIFASTENESHASLNSITREILNLTNLHQGELDNNDTGTTPPTPNPDHNDIIKNAEISKTNEVSITPSIPIRRPFQTNEFPLRESNTDSKIADVLLELTKTRTREYMFQHQLSLWDTHDFFQNDANTKSRTSHAALKSLRQLISCDFGQSC